MAAQRPDPDIDIDKLLSQGFRRPRHWFFLTPTIDTRYQVYCRLFALASVARLTLPDALQSGWLLPAALHWLGVVVLWVNGSLLGWGLCAVGTAWPLLLLQDQLSQSTYLCFCSLAALLFFLGPVTTRGARLATGLPLAVRSLTLLVYLFAAMHKLNRGYLDPEISCANEGLRVLAEHARLGLPAPLLASFDSSGWALAHLFIEAAIPCLLLWRPALGVLLAAAMHVPLTVIFAPSFAFTMASGWVCFFTADELRRLGAALLRHKLLIAGLGMSLGVTSRLLFFTGRFSEDPEWGVKEFLFFLLLAAVGIGLPAARLLRSRGAWQENSPVKWPAWLLVGLFTFNAFTPYLGLQFHHTAAMLSNLRIDQGCHNSLLFPEQLRLYDPYVRLDDLAFDPRRATAEARRTFTERLWEPSALYRAREEWCRIHDEPLPARGSYGGQPFAVADFCADEGWVLPKPMALGWRRFQVNLTKGCRKRCLH